MEEQEKARKEGNGDYCLLRSKSMRFSSRNCEASSAIRFSCSLTLRSNARVDGGAGVVASGTDTGTSDVKGACADGSCAVSGRGQGGTAAHPPLIPSKPASTHPALRDQLMVFVAFPYVFATTNPISSSI